jgi:hypothetical protein
MRSVGGTGLCQPQGHRAEQAGAERNSFRSVELLNVGDGAALFLRQPGVPDQAVGPEVDDLDFQFVQAGPHRVMDLYPPGGGPDDSKLSAVEPHASEVFDNAQIEEAGEPKLLRLLSDSSNGFRYVAVPE